MRLFSFARFFLILAAFSAGFLSHFFYQRWNVPPQEDQGYPVTFSASPPPAARAFEIPFIEAREVDKIRALAGNRAKIRGRIFRVGYSTKSDTYFLNFGPSSGSFTGVIFASAVERFQKNKLNPKHYEGKQVELTGEIRDHPQYGLEMILEDPTQVRLLD